MKKQYGIYEVSESFREDGLWQGYTVRCVDSSTKKQGKLYIKTDGRENYQAKHSESFNVEKDEDHRGIKQEKKKDDELEI